MKNLVLENWFKCLAIISFLLFTQTSNAIAVEGTCSWHGGVNCSAMADWDGSAVCNDGWRDSSEYYFQMQECKISRHYCTQDESNQINLKYGIAEKNQAISDVQAQMNQLYIDEAAAITKARSSGETSSFGNAQIAQIERETTIKLLQLNSFLYAAQSAYWNVSNQADKECYALGDIEYYKLQDDYYKQLQTQTQQTQNIPQYTCSSNLILNGDKCVCGDGLAWYGNLCIPINDYCHAKFGINSQGNKQGCNCSDGYAWNLTQTACDKINVQATSQSSPVPNLTPKPDLKNFVLPKKTSAPIKKQEQKKIIVSEDIISTQATTTQQISTSTQSENLNPSSEDKKSQHAPVLSQSTPQKPSIFGSILKFFSRFKFW